MLPGRQDSGQDAVVPHRACDFMGEAKPCAHSNRNSGSGNRGLGGTQDSKDSWMVLRLCDPRVGRVRVGLKNGQLHLRSDMAISKVGNARQVGNTYSSAQS